jgi:tryptophanyl-tRNA synthetase
MAADILTYKATHVPVGDDQKQHLELSRDIAARFNSDFKVDGFFPLPEPIIGGPAARVMNLQDGSKKMSKSDPADNSRINMTDSVDLMVKKIKKAKTDTLPMPSHVDELKGRPEVDNLVSIYAALSGLTKEQVVAEFVGAGFGVFKPRLADLAVEALGPTMTSMANFLADPAQIDAILRAGADRANAIAQPILKDTKAAVGFWS